MKFVNGVRGGALFALVAGTLLALAGVYQTDAFGWPVVWFYWVGLIGFGTWVGAGASAQVDALLPPDETHAVVRWAAISASVTAPMIGAVVVTHVLLGQRVDAASLSDFAIKVFIITAGVTAVRLAASERGKDGDTPSTARAEPASSAAKTLEPRASAPDAIGAPPETIAPTAATPTIAKRLPDRLRGAAVLALSAEDHYVRVHTAAGDALVLMRLSDAIDEVGRLHGARVHRSWWVARHAVEKAERAGDGAKLTLANGLVAPVSRQRIAALADAGWLA
ncbi:MAG: LytTR family DNA-binding domain-containing protein [Pseudomonadota bacterium]